MSEYYILSHDSSRDDLEVVSDYEMDEFDLTAFWNGERFQGSIPSEVRLWVAKGKPSDYLGNPVSWPIVSDRLWSNIRGLVESQCQLFNPPLYYEGSETPVKGYSLMNVTCTVAAACLDNSEADLSIGSLVLDNAKIPRDANLFRLAESTTVLIVSSRLVKRMSEIQLQGIALIEVNSR